jgi:hypothetical protein
MPALIARDPRLARSPLARVQTQHESHTPRSVSCLHFGRSLNQSGGRTEFLVGTGSSETLAEKGTQGAADADHSVRLRGYGGFTNRQPFHVRCLIGHAPALILLRATAI